MNESFFEKPNSGNEEKIQKEEGANTPFAENWLAEAENLYRVENQAKSVERRWLNKEFGTPPPIVWNKFPLQSKEVKEEELEPTKEAGDSFLLKEFLQKDSLEPMSKDEKEALLKPEMLKELTTEEYISLWKRLNPGYFSHVTRQGFRENYFYNHIEGKDEFHNGFVDILEGGKRLRSSHSLETDDKFSEAEKKYMDILEKLPLPFYRTNDKVDEEVSAWRVVKNSIMVSMGKTRSVGDKVAVHFAHSYVLSEKYGAENDNHIFFLYPEDVITSQFNFNAISDSKTTLDPKNSSLDTVNSPNSVNNDVLVWNKDSPEKTALSLDAGLVFIPKSTLVDRETGSRYSNVEKKDGEAKYFPALDTISSMEYWQNYFLENPELAPKRIIFYDGEPSQAVSEFLEEFGIKDEKRDEYSEVNSFPENYIPEDALIPLEEKFLMHGANAVAKYFEKHPEVFYEEALHKGDLEEMEKLLAKF